MPDLKASKYFPSLNSSNWLWTWFACNPLINQKITATLSNPTLSYFRFTKVGHVSPLLQKADDGEGGRKSFLRVMNYEEKLFSPVNEKQRKNPEQSRNISQTSILYTNFSHSSSATQSRHGKAFCSSLFMKTLEPKSGKTNSSKS